MSDLLIVPMTVTSRKRGLSRVAIARFVLVFFAWSQLAIAGHQAHESTFDADHSCAICLHAERSQHAAVDTATVAALPACSCAYFDETIDFQLVFPFALYQSRASP